MKLHTTPPSVLTPVTWVPQNRQGKLHPSLLGAPHPLRSDRDPNSRDLGTAEKAGEAPPLTPGVVRTPPFCRKALHQG